MPYTEEELADMKNLQEIANSLGITYNLLHGWSSRHERNGFPAPVAVHGKYKLYSQEEVTRWYQTWTIVNKRLGKKGGVYGQR